MNKQQKKRFTNLLIILALLSLATVFILYALSENINLFYSPKQIANNEAPKDRKIRVGGMVVIGSLKRINNSMKVEFDLTDNHSSLHVIFDGILPDLFREGQGVVADGLLIDNNSFKAEQILAKHDEKYMPPEVNQALQAK